MILRDFDRKVRGKSIGKIGIIVDMDGSEKKLRRNIIVKIEVILKVGKKREGKWIDIERILIRIMKRRRIRIVIILKIGKIGNFGEWSELEKKIEGEVRKFKKMKKIGDSKNIIDRVRRRIVIGRVIMGGKKYMIVKENKLLKRENGFLEEKKKREDNMGKEEDVKKRKERIEKVRKKSLRKKKRCFMLNKSNKNSNL